VGFGRLGDVDATLCPLAGAARAGSSGVDGVASAARISMAPTSASPTAIETLTRRLVVNGMA